MSQRDAFLDGEADHYFVRNRKDEEALTRAAGRDPVLRMVREHCADAQRVLEIGASDGWRLAQLLELDPRRTVDGIDPSAEAVADGIRRFPGVRLTRGTADSLPYERGAFDLVILGFLLYLCDRDDLFRIAAEVDRVLAPHGAIVLLDFRPPAPERRPYTHVPGLMSYKMDYKRMFLWNPAYRCVRELDEAHPGATPSEPGSRISTALLRRDPERAYADWTAREGEQ